MTTLIKKAGTNLFESTRATVQKLCNDGMFCENVMMTGLGCVVISIMWLSLSQLA